MCGILGQINISSGEALKLDLDKIGHRGPDGRGEWKNSEGNVYLGHTRLAILEPSPEGHQPMFDASKLGTLVFNGEIYNHQDLRLLLPDVSWRGNSDTETLVELLAALGLKALNLLKGMFAFAFYDSRDQSVLIVRDRLGIKPLYLKFSHDTISFSSEIRALLEQGKLKFTKKGLSQYIGFGHFPQDSEIVNDIYSVPAGSWIKINRDGTLEKKMWWSGENFSKQENKLKKKDTKEVKQFVTRAIEEHLISDVGVGAFLSGGIDSSIIALVAGKKLGKNLRTFTVGFPQSEYDERDIARKVADRIGSDHTELNIDEEACVNWVKEAVNCLDLPSLDAINTYIISKAVKDAGLKVALSGLGGDELFGGYPAFKKVPSVNWFGNLPDTLRKGSLLFLPHGLKMKLEGLTDYSVVNLTVASRRFTSASRMNFMGLNDGVPQIPAVPKSFDKMSKISWAEIYGYMIPMLLRDSDQMSMAVGLEIRVPFLDHHLVEHILKLPENHKKGRRMKSLLVEAFKKDLVPEVYNRPKQGFVLPMQEWLNGPLRNFAEEGIHVVAQYLKSQEPVVQMSQFTEGKLHWTRIWHWSVLGHWLIRQNQFAQSADWGNENSKILLQF
ncbi:asparagine synthase (glutamine-hydrolyzing) [Salinimicrobium sp. TH3]|uniref:asparagine synthase (glutamine-hydrolyzing) n=1 Tax=Salinimicrobium sp. TH3 TaxID=2997342 RepID=UPI00227606A6|nr:asparagine synthase (glutamine-hydrolyzing) [Salinimicrobium sp. TH3]MCY2687945.1 asparagine synthase (glutamine-hydrolyzing) [Salinimicrobium sp. TH3]